MRRLDFKGQRLRPISKTRFKDGNKAFKDTD